MRALIQLLVNVMTVLGGVVLCSLIALTCASVAGRALNTLLHGPIEAIAPEFSAWALGLGIGPINGDFELVEAGVAFAIFAFLPLCQFRSGHAVVDIFTSGLRPNARRLLRAVIEIVFASVLVLITVQLAGGMVSKMRFGETTLLLQFPIWWSYALSLSACSVAALVGMYMAGVRTTELLTGRDIHPDDPEDAH